MSNRVTVSEAAAMLSASDRIWILTHQFPDGDTLGSAFALCRALRTLGKSAQVKCSDPFPQKFAYMWDDLPEQVFEPDIVCAVDVADQALLGAALAPLVPRIVLCIDHHASHRDYAENLLLDPTAGATAMILLQVVEAMGVSVDTAMADCLYTGITTDTGCFKYSNVSPLTHRMAAQLMECGAHASTINQLMFDTKSRSRLKIERLALASITYHFGEKCAMMTITEDMLQESGATEDDLEGLSPLPRQIEGVWVGLTLRQKKDGNYKVSVRTGTHADASAICGLLGGGGHPRAAGCTLSGSLQDVSKQLLSAVEKAVPRITE